MADAVPDAGRDREILKIYRLTITRSNALRRLAILIPRVFINIANSCSESATARIRTFTRHDMQAGGRAGGRTAPDSGVLR